MFYGMRVQGSGFGVQGLGLGVWGFGFWVSGLGPRLKVYCRVYLKTQEELEAGFGIYPTNNHL